jgi:uracil-DNA glycosylase
MNALICPFEIEASWKVILEDELQKPYMLQLAAFVEKERAAGISIYPPKELVFNAFNLTPYDKVNVLIVGQDPYHGPGQAHGLCFSVPENVDFPPSLRNIFKELKEDVGMVIPDNGCLIPWAKQGVMLLNTTLTVRQGTPLSHAGKGWERFTDVVIAKLSEREDPVIFVLWGNAAKEKVAHIKQLEGKTQHFLLSAAHPSPFSANNGFFGCRHFSKINEILLKLNKKPIDWSLSKTSL